MTDSVGLRFRADPPAPIVTPEPTPAIGTRLRLAAAAGLVAALIVTVFYWRAGPLAVSDWDATWVATRAMLRGESPYAAIQMPPWPWHLNYPVPALILSVPFAFLPLEIARAAFVAVGTAIFTFVITRRHYWMLYCVGAGAMLGSWIPVQWSPLLVAAALTPALEWTLVAKPTTGFALWAARPGRIAVVGGVALLAVSLAIQPHWIREWLDAVANNPHRPPFLRPGGFLLLLGLLRWRRPEGRLLAVLCIVPQTTGLYETLPLVLLIQTRLQALGFAVLTMLATVVYHVGPEGPWPVGAEFQWLVLLALVYLPALGLVLGRPNEGTSREGMAPA